MEQSVGERVKEKEKGAKGKEVEGRRETEGERGRKKYWKKERERKKKIVRKN